MIVTLPKPPSINHIYGYTSAGGFARSYITKRGKDWFSSAAQELVSQVYQKKLTPIEKPVFLRICLYTSRMQDIDNILKPILDLLSGTCLECQNKYTTRTACYCGKKIGVLKDDRYVFELFVKKIKVEKKLEERVEVEWELL
jgi:Holliday junction resolvase RusA-like endonuclease